MEKISIGKIKSVDARAGYGIIVDADGPGQTPYGANVYFQVSDVSGTPREGQIVRFVKEMTKVGPQAKDISILGSA